MLKNIRWVAVYESEYLEHVDSFASFHAAPGISTGVFVDITISCVQMPTYQDLGIPIYPMLRADSRF